MTWLRAVLLAVLALTALVLIAAFTVPASVIADRLPPPLSLEGVRGNLLAGSVDAIQFKRTPLGQLTWAFAPLALLRGEVAYDINLSGHGHHVRGRFGITPLRTAVLHHVEIEWPLRSLSNDIQWGGQLSASIETARVRHAWPDSAMATITVRHFMRPDSDIDLGSFTVELGAGSEAHQIEGHLRDIDGPLSVQATILLSGDHSYRVDGSLLPRAGTPEDIKDSFTFLGPPDISGRRAFQIAGTM
jgi:hypothetical protein